MEENISPFAIIIYESSNPTLWVPRGDPDAPPWERCLAYFLRQLYERSRSENTVRDYRRTLVTFFSSSAHGGPPKHPEHYTREDVEDFLHRPSTSRRNVGAVPTTATMNQRLAILSSFYKFAGTFTIPGPDGSPQPLLQTSSPTLGLRHRRPDRTYRAFSEEELDRFVDVIPTDTGKGLRDRAILSRPPSLTKVACAGEGGAIAFMAKASAVRKIGQNYLAPPSKQSTATSSLPVA